jgi:general transcription factor 3C polypeptide 1
LLFLILLGVEVVLSDASLNIPFTFNLFGFSYKQVCERLQLDLKKNHSRLINLCYRFGMKAQEEQCLKSKTYRVWTSRNFNPVLRVALINKLDENKILDQHVLDSSSKITSEFEASTFNG